MELAPKEAKPITSQLFGPQTFIFARQINRFPLNYPFERCPSKHRPTAPGAHTSIDILMNPPVRADNAASDSTCIHFIENANVNKRAERPRSKFPRK